MLRMMVYKERLRKRVYLPKRDYTGTENHRPADPTHVVLDIRPVLRDQGTVAGIEERVGEGANDVGKALDIVGDGRTRIPTNGERYETETMIDWRKRGSET